MMMRCVVDTNIVLDCCLRREPFYDSAVLFMILCKMGEFDCWIGSHQFGDLTYLLTHGGNKSYADFARRSLLQLREAIHVYPEGEDEADECLKSDWDDLEDALVYQVARGLKADAIITRNQKDFKRSKIPVFDCDEFFAWLRKAKGVDYGYIEF